MNQEKAQLEQRIWEAFREADRNLDGPVTDGTDPESNSYNQFYRGRANKNLSARDAFRKRSSLSFFDDISFRYYLPAFMVHSLDEDELAETVIHHLTFQPNFPNQWKRVLALLPIEIACVVDYLEFVPMIFPYLADDSKAALDCYY